jgi:hypothetical protein
MRRHTSDPSRRGSALLAVVAMTLTIAMLSAILLQQSVGHLQRQSGAIDKKQALYLAEAGLAEGLASLRAGNSGNIGTETTPAAFGDGAFWVEAREDANGLFLLEATGIAGTARATLETIVEPVFAPVAALGLVGLEGVTIEAGAAVGPYLGDPEVLSIMADEADDPAVAEYLDALADAADATLELGLDLVAGILGGGATPPEIPFQLVVGSNGQIRVQGGLLSPTVVVGDLAPGPDSAVELGLGVDVAGSTAPRTSKIEPPTIQRPDLPMEPAFNLPAGATLGVGPDARNFGAVQLGAGSTLRISGPATLVTRTLSVGDNARLEIDPSGGPVDIYTVGGVKFGRGAELVNLAESASGLRLHVEGAGGADIDRDGRPDPAVTLPQAGPLHLQLVAPAADVTVPAGQRLFGSVAAGRLTIGRGAQVLFDNALLATDERDAALEIVSWKVLEIPESVRRELGSDLLTELRRANGGRLPRPAEVEQPVAFGAVYETPDGEERIYRGTLADFTAKDDGSEDDEIGLVRRVLNTALPEDSNLLRRRRLRLAEVAK